MNTRTLALAALLCSGCGSSLDAGSEAETPTPTEPTPTAPSTPTGGPAISSIDPAYGSPAMEVTLTGSGFTEGSRVFFGSSEAVVTAITATEIRVHPAAPQDGARGETSVVVRDGDRLSNAIAFSLYAAGDVFSREVAQIAASDVIALPSGDTLLADRDRGSLFRLAADGWLTTLTSSFPAGGARLSASDDGAVYAAAADGLHEVDPATGATALIAAGAWGRVIPFGDELLALRADGSAIDRVGIDDGWILPSGACASPVDMAVVGSTLYTGTADGTVCSAPTVQDAALAPIVTSGEIFAIRALRASADRLAILGYSFYLGEAVMELAADGTLSITGFPHSQGVGFDIRAGSPIVASVGGQVTTISGGTATVLVSPLLGISGQSEIDGRILVTSGFGNDDLPILAEIRDDGAVRVLASSEQRDTWTSIIGGDALYVASSDEGLILRIAANGAVSTFADHSETGPIYSMVRDVDGSFLIADGDGVARFGSTGESLGYVMDLPGACGLAFGGGDLWIAAGNTVARMIPEGDVDVWIGEGHGFTGLNAITSNHDGSIFVADGADSGAIMAINESGTTTFSHGDAVVGLSLDSKGRVLVADGATSPYMMLP